MRIEMPLTSRPAAAASVKASAAARRAEITTLLVCVLVSMTEGFDLGAMSLSGPHMIRDLALRPADFGLAVTAMMAGFFFGAGAGGRLGDRRGHKRVLLASMLLAAVFSYLTSHATSVMSLVLIRFVTGMGIGGVFPNMLAIGIDAIQSPARRARTLAIINCGGSLGSLCGALLLVSIGHAIDWRIYFQIGGLAPVFVLVLAWKFLAESTGRRAVLQDTVRQALFASSRRNATLLLWVANFISAAVWYMLANWTPTLLVQRGLSASQVGLAMASLSVCAMLGVLVLAALYDRKRGPAAFVIAFLGMGLVVALFASAGSLQTAVLATAGVGLFVLGGQLLLYTLPAFVYPAAAKSTGMGWYVAVGRLGAIVSPALMGVSLQAGLSPQTILHATLPFIAIAAVASVWVARKHWSGEETSTTT